MLRNGCSAQAEPHVLKGSAHPKHAMPNRLSQETSPYLLQHAENPVDWYPWGPEALERAEREDKPILLSIGYAACHWCHVMEHESFENPATAALMNEHFVCIKVDREERPDLDDIYMAATLAINGNGGWPMTVFLTPEQTPFFAGTYFPPDDKYGRPGFGSLLRRIASLWDSDRDSLFRQAGELTDHIRAQSSLEPATDVSAETVDRAVKLLARSFDPEFGGFGGAPKFPPSQSLHLLLRHYARTADPNSLQMLTTTLDAMKNGGIYDQIAGGFARYSVDERWLVPHFEKMLYDNAQLARVYTEAFQVTRNPEYERVVRETLDYILREMQADEGGYYSATDADSEGEEGKFFVFTPQQVSEIVDADLSAAVCAYYDVTEGGNFEGSNILNVPRPAAEVAEELGISQAELMQRIEKAKPKLYAARQKRIPPLTDDKVLVAWNALMIGAMAEAARVFDEPRYLQSAERAAGFIQQKLTLEGGKLLRTARAGKAHIDAYLEDYAYLCDALIDLYEASADEQHLERAKQLAELLLSEFRDEDSGAFFQTAADHEQLIVRTRDGHDGALPNAGAIAAKALARLAVQLDAAHFNAAARSALRAYGQRIERMPRGFVTALNLVDFLLQGPVELVFAGASESLQKAAAQVFLPHRVIGYATEQAEPRPLLTGKQPLDGKAALYICRNFTCQAPLTDASAVEAALQADFDAAIKERRSAIANEVITGQATAEGTTRYAGRKALPKHAYRRFGKTGLLVSRLGFGAYRVQTAVSEHQEALQLALRQGCNLIDTAAIYTQGNSERSIGNALSELLRKDELQRDEVVVVSKLGIRQSDLSDPSQISDRVTDNGHGQRFEQMEEVGPGVSYSLHQSWLETQLSESLERLGLDTLDVCLLHNPEMLLNKLERDEVLARLKGAFAWLEQKRQEGRISWYGISSNALGSSGQHGLPIAELLSAAEGFPGFAVVQLPLNPLELGARAAAQAAADAGLAVLSNRPLNAIRQDTLVRLAEADEDLAAPDFTNSVSTVADLETEFRQRLGAVLGAVPELQLKPEELFTWSEQIGEHELSSRELWQEFERGVLAPQLSTVISAMEQAFAGKSLGSIWKDWRQRYTEALEALVVAARQRAAQASNTRIRGLKAALQADGAAESQASLSQLVLWGLSSEPQISAVLVGMRTPRYVQDALATLSWSPHEAGLSWLKSAAERLDR